MAAAAGSGAFKPAVSFAERVVGGGGFHHLTVNGGGGGEIKGCQCLTIFGGGASLFDHLMGGASPFDHFRGRGVAV